MTRGKADTITEMLDEMLRLKGRGWYKILSGSMYPLIEINDRIFTKHLAPSEVRTGDIVLFKSGGVLVTHRVIQCDRKNSMPMILQKGDASAHASLIAPESIVGKVVAIEKKGRILDLTAGRVKMLDRFLGMKSCIQYRLAAGVDRMKGRTGNTPGSESAGDFTRIAGRPFGIFQRLLVKLCL